MGIQFVSYMYMHTYMYAHCISTYVHVYVVYMYVRYVSVCIIADISRHGLFCQIT